MLAAADFRVDAHTAWHRDAHQLHRIVTIESDVIDAAARSLTARSAALPNEPQQFRQGIAQRPQQQQPARERLLALLGALAEPIEIVGQVEFTGAAGNGAAVADRTEELRVLQRQKITGPGRNELTAQAQQVGDHGAQSRCVNARLRLEFVEHADLPLELLQCVGPRVCARRDRDDIEQAGDRRPTAPVARGLAVEQRLVVEEVDTQEGAHPLGERLLEHDWGGRCSHGCRPNFGCL